jgi:hypothetical protein
MSTLNTNKIPVIIESNKNNWNNINELSQYKNLFTRSNTSLQQSSNSNLDLESRASMDSTRTIKQDKK